MKGGRVAPETATDRQCTHCGLWFTAQGIGPHEENCDLCGMDVVVIPVVDDSAADVLQGASPDPSPAEGATQTVEPDAVEGATPDEPAGPVLTEGSTVTDGGRAMAPPTPDVEPDRAAPDELAKDVVDDVQEATEDVDETDDVVECPTCGEPTGDDPDDLTDGRTYRGTCGHRFRWRAE